MFQNIILTLDILGFRFINMQEDRTSWSRFKFVVIALTASFSLAQQWVCIILVGFPWLRHTPSLADVTMEIKACTLQKQ
jgi:hypothetical protein